MIILPINDILDIAKLHGPKGLINVDIDHIDDTGMTALTYALITEDYLAAMVLIYANADCTKRSIQGSPLTIILNQILRLEGRQESIVDKVFDLMLLQKINYTYFDEPQSPLELVLSSSCNNNVWASSHHDFIVSIARKLIEAGADLAEKDTSDSIFYAIKHGAFEIVQLLLTKKPECVLKKNAWGETTFLVAIKNKQDFIFEILMEHCEMTFKHKSEHSGVFAPYLFEIVNELTNWSGGGTKIEMLKIALPFVDATALNARNATGEPLLLCAILDEDSFLRNCKVYFEAIRALVEAGADINIKTKDGLNLIAIVAQHLKSQELILKLMKDGYELVEKDLKSTQEVIKLMRDEGVKGNYEIQEQLRMCRIEETRLLRETQAQLPALKTQQELVNTLREVAADFMDVQSTALIVSQYDLKNFVIESQLAWVTDYNASSQTSSSSATFQDKLVFLRGEKTRLDAFHAAIDKKIAEKVNSLVKLRPRTQVIVEYSLCRAKHYYLNQLDRKTHKQDDQPKKEEAEQSLNGLGLGGLPKKEEARQSLSALGLGVVLEEPKIALESVETKKTAESEMKKSADKIRNFIPHIGDVENLQPGRTFKKKDMKFSSIHIVNKAHQHSTRDTRLVFEDGEMSLQSDAVRATAVEKFPWMKGEVTFNDPTRLHISRFLIQYKQKNAKPLALEAPTRMGGAGSGSQSAVVEVLQDNDAGMGSQAGAASAGGSSQIAGAAAAQSSKTSTAPQLGAGVVKATQLSGVEGDLVTVDAVDAATPSGNGAGSASAIPQTAALVLPPTPPQASGSLVSNLYDLDDLNMPDAAPLVAGASASAPPPAVVVNVLQNNNSAGRGTTRKETDFFKEDSQGNSKRPRKR